MNRSAKDFSWGRAAVLLFAGGWFLLAAFPAPPGQEVPAAPDTGSLEERLRHADSLLEEEAYEPALAHFRQAEAMLAGAGDSLYRLVAGNIALCEGNIALGDRRFDAALAAVRRAQTAFLDARNYEKAVYSLLDEALVRYYSGAQQKMKSALETAEDLSERHLPAGHAYFGLIYHLQGFVYQSIGDYSRAADVSRRALDFYQRQEPVDSAGIRTIYNNLGAFYRRMGHYDKALEYYLAGLHLVLESSAADKLLLQTIYRNLSVVYRSKENYREALYYNQRALELLSAHPPQPDNYEEYIRTYQNRAVTFNRMYSYDSALVCLNRAMALHRFSDYNKELTLDLFGGVYREMGALKEAERYFRQAIALNLAKNGSGHWLLPQSYRQLGALLFEGDAPAAALPPLQQALISLSGPFRDSSYLHNPPLEDFVAPTDLLLVLRDKGRVLEELARRENDPRYLRAAFSTLELATRLIDSMRNEYLESTYHFWNEEAGPVYEKAISVSERLFRQTGEESYLEAAFRFAEKSKAHALAVALQDAAARQVSNIPPAMLERERSIRLEKAYYKELIFRERQRGIDADTSKILLWQGKVLEAGQAGEALMAELERDYPTYHRLKYNFEVADLTAVRSALPPQSVLLEYFMGEEQWFVFTVTAGEAFIHTQRRDSAVDRRLQAMLEQLQDRRRILERGNSMALFEAFAALGSDLYEVWLRPALARAPVSQLIVIADGALSYLPFELLLEKPVPAGGEVDYASLPYLLKRCPLRYEYSATLLTRPVRDQGTQRGFTGFAPIYGSNLIAVARDVEVHCADARGLAFGKLANNQREVAAIAEQWGGLSFLSQDATEAAFRRHAAGSNVLHLAMHGFINHCDPHYSGLVFTLPPAEKAATGDSAAGMAAAADDGILHAYEIYTMQLDADLAVLSACQTGAGQFARGEGVMSLARAFRYAGCANVLTSLWQADDGATMAVMEHFYELLAQGKRKDEALQGAKLRYLQNSNRNHPFFWGAFVLLGDDRPVELPEKGSPWVWMIALLVAGSAAAWWRKRLRS